LNRHTEKVQFQCSTSNLCSVLSFFWIWTMPNQLQNTVFLALSRRFVRLR